MNYGIEGPHERSTHRRASHTEDDRASLQAAVSCREPVVLPGSVPLLAVRVMRERGVHMRGLHTLARKAVSAVSVCAAVLWCGGRAWAYTVVTASTAAPAGIEQKFIAATTAQFNASLFVNPLASNTYAIKLFGLNPNYVPPPQVVPLDFAAIISSVSFNYVYGFVDGQYLERKQDLNMVGSLDVMCSTPTAFGLIQATTATWSAATCMDVLGTLNSQIYQQNFSTPTVIGGY